jgi:hypothetical protein
MQDPFRTRFQAGVLGTCALCFGAAAFAALVRTMPLLLTAGSSLRAAWPFLRSLLLLALETSMLFALPMGAAFSVQAHLARGEARAFEALGFGPFDVLLRAKSAFLAFIIVFFSVSYFGGVAAKAPGFVLGQLVAEAELACLRETERSHAGVVVPVPLLQASWLCGEGEQTPAYLVGKTPMSNGSSGAYRTRSLTLSGDMQSLTFEDAQILVQHVSLSAKHITVRGLPVLATIRAATMPAWLRAISFALVALSTAVIAFVTLWRARLSKGVLPALVGATGPVVSLVLLRALDASARLKHSNVFMIAAGVLGLPLAAAVCTLVVSRLVVALSLRVHRSTGT